MKRPKKEAAPPSPAPAPSSSAAWAAGAPSWLLGLSLAFAFIASAAPTYDEPVHLASGRSYLATGLYRLNITDHPPLAEMWAALPSAAMRVPAMTGLPDFQAMRRYAFADSFLYRNSVDAERLLNAARRFSFATSWTLLAAALALWAGRLAGPWAAAAATAAAALSPVLVTNLALVTTDGLSAVLFFTACALAAPGPGGALRWAAAGAAAGLAMASKFNMVLLGGLLPAVVLAESRLDRESRGGRARGAALAAGAALFAVAAVYRFGQLGLFVAGLRATAERLGEGRASYLLGGYGTTGTWLYFPAALFAKSPLGLLALAGWGAACAARRPARAERLWLLVPPAAYFAASLTAKVQIGVRHLLPVFPFLALWCGLAAADLARRGAAARAALALLLAWPAASVLRAAPRLLSYFNEAAGGPAGGWRWLADSNLDWGQDLKGLAAELEARGNPPVYLAYFGVADPSYYRIRYVQALPNWNVPRPGDDVDPAASGPVLFAVSATNRVGVYIAKHDLFSWLDGKAPVAAPGGSIFLYDLTSDAEGRRRLAELLEMAGHPRAAGLKKSLLLE